MTQKTHARKRRKIRRFNRKVRVQRNVKDRLFRFLFAGDREALLQLYNALNGTNYRDASQLQVVTIESAVYVVMKNDLAFVLAGTLNMYEHQSTYSPNLPVRFLIYLAQEYQMVVEQAEESLYGTEQIFLPTPKCVVFYNGQRDMPEKQTFRLSDAFMDKRQEADVELTVQMYNINYGYNSALMEKCRTLGEYSEFVGITREYMSREKNAETALSDAVDYCISHGILEAFLRKNRAEVLGMLLEEFDVEKYERSLKKEGREEGIREGMELGMRQGIEQGIEQGIRCMVEALQETEQTKIYVTDKIAEKYKLSKEEAKQRVTRYWR